MSFWNGVSSVVYFFRVPFILTLRTVFLSLITFWRSWFLNYPDAFITCFNCVVIRSAINCMKILPSMAAAEWIRKRFMSSSFLKSSKHFSTASLLRYASRAFVLSLMWLQGSTLWSRQRKPMAWMQWNISNISCQICRGVDFLRILNIWMNICHGIPWYRNGVDKITTALLV